MTPDATLLEKLDELLTAIRGYDDPRQAASEWKQAYRALQKTDLPSGRITGVVGMRNVDGLADLIDQFRAPGEAPDGEGAPDAETCRRALRAFRKRAKLTRLDDESQLGHGPLSRGAGSEPTAIVPPREWPEPVWRELVRQGKLRYVGHGLYQLPDD
ncbi:MAG: hypothetical protein ACOC8F_02445 [Planctomycetota bacterium]